jgi:hypothetical protein
MSHLIWYQEDPDIVASGELIRSEMTGRLLSGDRLIYTRQSNHKEMSEHSLR